MSTLIVFDLDGVLYSSEPFLGEAYREAIANVNARRPGSFDRVPSTAELLAHVGWTLPVMLARLFPGAPEEATGLLNAEVLDVICRRIVNREGRMFDDVPETLERLGSDGHIIALASNGRSRYVETVLSTCGIARFFVERIVSGEADRKLAALRGYLQLYGVPASNALMIGDRSSDVDAARAVGCRFIGCDYGHGHRDEIESAGPVIDRFRDLPSVVESLLKRDG